MNGEKVIELLRHLRHDFGNHLQVISGYLELGRSDEVKKYIQTLALEMSEERVIFEDCSPEVAWYFYQQLLLARERGIKMRFQDLKVSSAAILEKHQEPLQSVVQVIERCGDNSLVSVSVSDSENGALLYISIDEQQEPLVVAVME